MAYYGHVACNITGAYAESQPCLIQNAVSNGLLLEMACSVLRKGHDNSHLSQLCNLFWFVHLTSKSAHTALAVKACLLGGNSNSKCSMTFVNIAVAISALAGGGPKTVSHRDQNTVVFSTFFEDFWVSERKRVLKWNFGSFW